MTPTAHSSGRTHRDRFGHRAGRRTTRSTRAGFTLLEVLVSTTILGMCVAMTMVVFGAALRRAQHTDNMLSGTTQLRYATDIIAQAVRSASQPPTIGNSGLQLLIPPKDQGYLLVDETTWIDQADGIKGTKSNQKNMHVDPIIPAVISTIYKTTSRPTGALSASDVSTYFVSSSASTTVSSMLAANDTVSIPATNYGVAVPSLTVNSVSQNSGTSTITFTTNVGVDVPQGTKITITSGRRIMFEVHVVQTSPYKKTELRYYPDSRTLTKYTVLAEDISDAPLLTPSNSNGGTTVPFAMQSGSTTCVLLNLQKIPSGTLAGRTLQGVQSAVYTRTDPTVP